MKKFINQTDMKKANAADIFSLIRKSGKITRKEIEAKTGFSWGAVSTITADLLERNYIREFKCKPQKSAGRTPSYLEVNSDKHFVLGVDINASGFGAVTVNLANEAVSSNSYNAVYSDKKSLLSEIIKFIRETLQLAEGKSIIGIGVAMQGSVDAKEGISISVPYCKDWSNVPLAYILNKEFDIPVFVEHDPDCILYSVLSEQSLKNAILIRVDNGIGMSVILDGKIFTKAGMFEIGHMTVNPGGAVCSCGKHGCLEAYASMKGMEKLAGTEFSKLAECAKNGEEKDKKIFEDMASYLAGAVLNTTQLLNIKKVVLCGEMWKYKALFYDSFLNKVNFEDSEENLEISFVDVKKAAMGAALIAIENSTKYIDFRKGEDK